MTKHQQTRQMTQEIINREVDSMIATLVLSNSHPNYIIYRFPPTFSVCHDHTTGLTLTLYPKDGGYSACPVVEDDYIHAQELGISPIRHRLAHEIWHHLIGIIVYNAQSSPVIYRDSHGMNHPSAKAGWNHNWIEEEWLVTAMSHAMYGDSNRDHGAVEWLKNDRDINVEGMLQIGRELIEGDRREFRYGAADRVKVSLHL